MTKIFHLGRDDWDLRGIIILWAYRTTSKKSFGQTPFRMVYRQEEIMSMEFIVPSLCVAMITNISESGAVEVSPVCAKVSIQFLGPISTK